MSACPNCSAILQNAATECPRCGAIFVKDSAWGLPGEKPDAQKQQLGCGTVVLLGLCLSIPCFWGAAFFLGALCRLPYSRLSDFICGHNIGGPIFALWVLSTVVLTTAVSWRIAEYRGRKAQRVRPQKNDTDPN